LGSSEYHNKRAVFLMLIASNGSDFSVLLAFGRSSGQYTEIIVTIAGLYILASGGFVPE